MCGWCLERRQEPREAGEMDRTQAINGFAMHIEGFALYSNSNRKPLKGFKQISDSAYIHFRKVTLAGVWAAEGRVACWEARRPLRKFWQQQRVVACTKTGDCGDGRRWLGKLSRK